LIYEPHRLVFLGETGTTTKMTRLRRRCLKAKGLFQRSIRTLEDADLHRRLALPRAHRAVRDRRADRSGHLRDLTYVATQLAPTLQPDDVVILDNLPAHKSAGAAASICAKGAWFEFLRFYSPDLNPIETAFAKLRACCPLGRSEPSTNSGAQSAKSAISSVPKNAKTTSPQQARDSHENPAL
jgi:hypothetical protein